MLIIEHRINTIAQLQQVPEQHGVELDIRSDGKELIIHHDPFEKGETLKEWLKHFRHRFIIFNVKEEGLENTILSLADTYRIKDFFFLDQSFPFLIKTAKIGETRCAVRVSEFEHINTALTLAGKVQWIWVDYFNHFPLSPEEVERLRNASFKLCLVSPELQGYKEPGITFALREKLKKEHIIIDAVCTKIPRHWL